MGSANDNSADDDHISIKMRCSMIALTACCRTHASMAASSVKHSSCRHADQVSGGRYAIVCKHGSEVMELVVGGWCCAIDEKPTETSSETHHARDVTIASCVEHLELR